MVNHKSSPHLNTSQLLLNTLEPANTPISLICSKMFNVETNILRTTIIIRRADILNTEDSMKMGTSFWTTPIHINIILLTCLEILINHRWNGANPIFINRIIITIMEGNLVINTNNKNTEQSAWKTKYFNLRLALFFLKLFISIRTNLIIPISM